MKSFLIVLGLFGITLTTFILLMAWYVQILFNGINTYERNNTNINHYYTIHALQERNKLLESELKEATRSSHIRNYLYYKGYPIYAYSNDLFDSSIAYTHNPFFMAALSLAESGGCLRYIYSTNNCFGYDSGRWTFRSIPEGIWYVAKKIGTGKNYQTYQKERTIRAFAQDYNYGNWQETEAKMHYFIQDIESWKKN